MTAAPLALQSGHYDGRVFGANNRARYFFADFVAAAPFVSKIFNHSP
jgi:hypothetical protein